MLKTFVNKTQILLNLTVRRHAGHSKWANIKHIKALKDSQKSMQFQKFARLMRIAITEGGSANPEFNVQLSQVIEQAKRASMPNSNIQNVLKSADVSKSDYRKQILELKGPGGCLILIELFTNNLPKCRMAISTVVKKSQYSFADSGVLRSFEYKSLIDVELPNELAKKDENVLKDICTEHAIMAGAEEVDIIPSENGLFEARFTCNPLNVITVEKALKDVYGYTIVSSTSEYLPINPVQCSSSELEQFEKFCAKLESVSEIVNVHNNLIIN